MMIVVTEEPGSICTQSTDQSSDMLADDQGRTVCTSQQMGQGTASPRCTGRSYRSAATVINKCMTEPRMHEPRSTRSAVIESEDTGSLRGSSCLGLPFLDINASIHIRTDLVAPRSTFRNESEDSQEANSYDCADASQVTRACAHARQQFQLDFLSSRLKDLSYALPVFTESEILIGNFLGRGSTGQVNQVCGFRINKAAVGNRIGKCSGKELRREFIVNHCYRDSGDARYAIKSIRQKSIRDSKELMQGMTDLNIETRFLSHLTANPHPNLIKLRAVASGDRFSPNFFILLDRLYDTLETRLEKWVDKAKQLDRSRNGLKAMFANRSRGFCGNDDLLCHAEQSALLDDQLRVAAGLSSAVAHMHKHGLMHRDIKSTNMGFNTRDDIKLFDLALAREIPHTMDDDFKRTVLSWKLTQMVGTPRCMAPEVALGWFYNEKCDVFSFAIVMWQIMGLQMKPYGNALHRNNIQFFSKSVWQGATVRPSMLFKKKRTSHTHFTPQLQELVALCWSHRWQDRPAMNVVEETLSNIIQSRTRSEKTVSTTAMEDEESLRYDSPHASPAGICSEVASPSSFSTSPAPHRNLLSRFSWSVKNSRKEAALF